MKKANPAKALIKQIKKDLEKVDKFFALALPERNKILLKAGKLKTKGFKFNREESNKR